MDRTCTQEGSLATENKFDKLAEVFVFMEFEEKIIAMLFDRIKKMKRNIEMYF